MGQGSERWAASAHANAVVAALLRNMTLPPKEALRVARERLVMALRFHVDVQGRPEP